MTGMVRVTLDDDDARLLGKSKEEAEAHLRFVMAAKLYELSEMTLGQAAQLCGMVRPRFMLKLHEVGVSVIDLDEAELKDELRVD